MRHPPSTSRSARPVPSALRAGDSLAERAKSLAELVAGARYGVPRERIQAFVQTMGVRGLPALVDVAARALAEWVPTPESAAEEAWQAWDVWQDGEPLDPRWPVIAMGVGAWPAAVNPLLEIMQGSAPAELAAEVRRLAAEGLARIGEPALPALRRSARSARADVRLWSYAALGWMARPDTDALLVKALDTDRELRHLVALVLVDRHRLDLVPGLVALLRSCAPRQRPAVECAVRYLYENEGPEGPLHEDWRIRYCVDPETGQLPAPDVLNWQRILEDSPHDPGQGAFPVRTLKEILLGVRPRSETCPTCSARWVSIAGERRCPTVLVERMWEGWAWLLRARHQNCETIVEALDALDEDAGEVAEYVSPFIRRGRKTPEPLRARCFAIRELRSGARTLLDAGVESIAEALSLREAEARRVAAAHGDPGNHLPRFGEVVLRTRPGHFVPAWEPCPCDSGRRYFACCWSLSRS